MITILYIFKNKDSLRVKRSLESLSQQTEQGFKVLFVDYGSNTPYKEDVAKLVSQYDFVDYHYSYHCDQAWSRAKAINIGLRMVATPFVFIADIDMIFRNDFVAKLHSLKDENKSIYFKVGFLSEQETAKEKKFEAYSIEHESKEGAKGLSLFPLKALMAIRGFDEFLHFWGAEDEDIHQRLCHYGLTEQFYTAEILMLHQWHLTYRNAEHNRLTKDLRVSNIPRINSTHFKYNTDQRKVIVNDEIWGRSIGKDDYELLRDAPISICISNRKELVDHFLFHQLKEFQDGIVSVTISDDSEATNLKTFLKRKLQKASPAYYSMKEVNDMLLLHIVSFYRNNNYIYNVSDDLKSIVFKIKK